MSLPNKPTFDFALSGASSNLTLGKGGPRVSSDGTNVQLLNTSGNPGNLTIDQGFFSNIGIGTASVSYPLDVWGNIHISNTATTSGILFPDGTFQTTAVTSTPPGGSNGWVQFNQNNAFGASQNFVFDNANVRLGIGTSYPSNTLNVWGNLQISNVNGLTSGILFPDGTFQDTATQNTPSFGSIGTIQLAGVNNTFSGDSTHLSWDSTSLALDTSNIVISNPSGTITGANTIAANAFIGNSSTISGNSSVGGNLSVQGNLFVGGTVTFSNLAVEQDLKVNSLTSNTYIQAGTQIIGNSIFSNTTIQANGRAIVNALISNANITGANLNISGTGWLGNVYSNGTIQSTGLATVNQLIANANIYGANLNIAGLAQVNSLNVNTATSTASLNVGAGGAIVGSLISNNSITGASLGIFGAAQVNSLISNTTIQSIGIATVNALYSNSSIQAAGNLTVDGVNSNGTIVGSQLTSNSSIQAVGNITAGGLNSNGTIVGSAITSNSSIQAAGSAVVNSLISNVNVGIGTATVTGDNVLSVFGSTNSVGNIYLVNTASTISGIMWPDGTFQNTAVTPTPSYGTYGTVQFAGNNNTFSGDSSNFYWDSINTVLDVSNINVASQATIGAISLFAGNGNVSGINFATANAFVGNALTIDGSSNLYGNLYVSNNFTVGGTVYFSNVGGIQNLVVNSLTSNSYIQAAETITANNIVANVNVGIGTATVNYPLDVYGNIHIGNTATGSGILFPDGSFQGSAAAYTPSYGAPGTIQLAGLANTFTGNTSALFWNDSSLALSVNGAIIAAGTVIAQSMFSNSTIQSTGVAQVGELYSNLNIHAIGTVTGNVLKSNTFVHAIGEVVGGTVNSNSTMQAAGTATVNALISNNNVFGTSLQTSGRATVSDLVSNTNITTDTLAAYGNVQIGALISNSTIQADGTATVNALISNTNVFGVTLQSSGTSNLANLVVNTNITTQVVNVTAEAWLNDVISNNNITTDTLNTKSIAQVNSLISNTSIQAIGGVTVNSLTSNTNVNASSANITNNLYAGQLNVNGTAQADLIISNTDIATHTLGASGEIVGQVIHSNTTIQSAGTTTVNELISNTKVTAGNGLVATAGGLQVTGNTSIAGNAYVSGNLYVGGNVITVNTSELNVSGPIIFVANANPGDVWDLGLVGNYNTTDRFYTGITRDYINGAWTVFDTATVKPINTVDWTQPGLTYGGFIAGNINAAGQTTSISSGTGAITIFGTGGLGVGGAINAGDQIATTAGLNIGATAIVDALISNTSIQATADAVLGSVTSNNTIQAAGTATVNALVSNTSISASSLQVTNDVIVNGLTSNTFIQSAGLTTTNSFASNGAAYIGGNLLVEGNVLIADPTASVDQFTGALVVTGGLGVGGNVNIAGVVTAGNVNANSASFFGNTETGYGALYAGLPSGYTILPNDIAQFSGNGNSYVQINLENISSGTNASADYIATANNGDDQTYYIDLGINGSAYDPVANDQTSQYANDSYLISVGNSNVSGYPGGNLVVGTVTPDTVLRIVAGGLMASNVVATFGPNLIDIAVPLTLESNLQIAGNVIVGSLTSNSTIQAAGIATVNDLISNSNVTTNGLFANFAQFNVYVATNYLESTTGIKSNAGVITQFLIANNNVQTNNVIAKDTVQGTQFYANTHIQAGGQILGEGIQSNTTIQAGGRILGQYFESNSTIQAVSHAVVGRLYSNGIIQGTGTATVGAFISNTTIQASGQTIVGSLISNTTVQTAGDLTAQSMVSNTSIVAAGTATVNALVSNTTIQSVGNATVGNLTSNGTITTTGTGGNIIGVNTLYTIDVSASGNIVAQNIISNATVGIGTAIAHYPLDVYGNIHIGNTATTNGIIFADGSFQASAASATKSFGQQYTIQFAGVGNSFSGDTSNFLWDNANLALNTSNLLVINNANIGANANIGNNINLGGNLNGSNTTIVTAKMGMFIGGNGGFGAIYAGLQDWTNYQPNTVALFTGNANAQAQINVHNENNGGFASTDIVATANNGTATDTYIDIGINSSGYNQTTVDGANDGYLFVHGNATTGGGNLVLGTLANNDIVFVQGGSTSANEVARFAYGRGLHIESILSVSNAAFFNNNITVANNSTFNSNLTVLGNLSVYAASIGSFDQINSRGFANVQILHSNGYVSGNTWVVDGNAHTSTSSVQQVVDSWPTASFRTAHYMLQITDTTTTAYQASQIMLLQDGTDVFLTEYADIYTSTSLGSWSADISSGLVELLFTPNNSDNMNIMVVRTTIDI
jgi:hypothetical protein